MELTALPINSGSSKEWVEYHCGPFGAFRQETTGGQGRGVAKRLGILKSIPPPPGILIEAASV